MAAKISFCAAVNSLQKLKEKGMAGSLLLKLCINVKVNNQNVYIPEDGYQLVETLNKFK